MRVLLWAARFYCEGSDRQDTLEIDLAIYGASIAGKNFHSHTRTIATRRVMRGVEPVGIPGKWKTVGEQYRSPTG